MIRQFISKKKTDQFNMHIIAKLEIIQHFIGELEKLGIVVECKIHTTEVYEENLKQATQNDYNG